MPTKRSTPNGRDACGPAALPQERGRAAQRAMQPDLLIYCPANDSVPAPQANHALYRKYMRTIRRPLSNMLETDLFTRPKTSFCRPSSCNHARMALPPGCGRQALHPRRAGAQPPSLIARPAPGAGAPATPGQLAWEILRRRQEYEGQPAHRQILRANPELLLIDAAPPPGDWGLCFRRGSGPASGRSLPVLGRRARWQRHPRQSGLRRESA